MERFPLADCAGYDNGPISWEDIVGVAQMVFGVLRGGDVSTRLPVFMYQIAC